MRLHLMLVALAIPTLSACAGPPVIAMWNPATAEFHDCKSEQVTALYEWHPATACAEAYKAKGWRVYY